MQSDLFRGPRRWRDRRPPAARPAPAAAEQCEVLPGDPLHPPRRGFADERARAKFESWDPLPAEWRHGPRLVTGGGICPQCARPYVEHYFDVPRFVAENAPLFGRGCDIEHERQLHKALLTARGAIECPWHCGYALVPPRSEAIEDEQCAAEEEQAEDAATEPDD